MKNSFMLIILLTSVAHSSDYVSVFSCFQCYDIATKLAPDSSDPEEYLAQSRNSCVQGIRSFAAQRLGSNTPLGLEQKRNRRGRIALELFEEAEENLKGSLLQSSYWQEEVANRGMWYHLDSRYTEQQKIDQYFKMIIDWEEQGENEARKWVNRIWNKK